MWSKQCVCDRTEKTKAFCICCISDAEFVTFCNFSSLFFLLYISNKKLVVLNLVDFGFLLLAFGYLKCTIVQKFAPLHCSFASGDS